MHQKRRRNLNRRSSRFESLEQRVVLDSTVVFNEIMYNPAGDTEATAEWIELYNQMGVHMDLSGWSLDGGVQYQFAEGTVMPGRSYLVVAIDPAALESAAGITGVLGPYIGQLSNAGEELRLLNNNGRVMNRIDYGDNILWPVGADGSGATLAKRDKNSGSDNPENWTSSLELEGTPGAANFASSITLPPVTETVIGDNSPARVRIPTSAGDLSFGGSQWNELAFDDVAASGWLDRETGIGFDTSGTSEVGPLIDASGDIETEMSGQNASALIRQTFQVSDPANVDNLQLNLDYNDGYVAFLNGTEVARQNAPAGVPDYNAAATGEPQGGYVAAVLADDPVAYFRFEEDPTGGTAFDSAVQAGAQNGTYVGVTATTGPLTSEASNNAAMFNGSTSRIDVPDPTGVMGSAGRWTIEFWMNNSSGGNAHQNPVTKGHFHGGGVTFFNNSTAFNNTLQAGINNGNSGTNLITSRPPNGVWKHVVGVFVPNGSNTDARMYIDGALADSTTIPGLQTNNSFEQLTIATLEFGQPPGSGAFVNHYKGALDEVAVYDYALDDPDSDGSLIDSRVADHFNAASGGGSVDVGHDQFILNDHLGSLVAGENVLAVQGLNASAADTDFLIRPELEIQYAPVTIDPAAPSPIMINEVASALDAQFRVEITNTGSSSINLDGYVLEATGATGGQYTFGSEVIAPGGFVDVTEAQLGFDAVDGDKLFLYAPTQTELVDARVVTDRLRGRSPAHDGDWLYPDIATPAAANSFAFSDDVVINEIMFHHRAELEIPATVERIPLISIDSIWKYEQSGIDLGTSWRDFSFNDSAWASGPGMLGQDSFPFPPTPFNTTLLTSPATRYLRHAFFWDGDTSVDAIRLRPILDGGAVFYLNGVEIHRANMPSGAISFSTPASRSINYASWMDVITIPTSAFTLGQNVLAVEVHTSGSSDIAFGAELYSTKTVTGSLLAAKSQVNTTLQDFNDTWRYRESATGLPSNWATTSHTVGIDQWQSGAGPIGFEAAALPVALQTTLGDPTTNNPSIVTYYFETDFTISDDPATVGLSLEHMIDDGAVFYVNGAEVLRYNIPDGPVDATTGAAPGVGNASLSGLMPIPSGSLVAGQNRLSVEVHQQTVGGQSSDIVFGMRLMGSTVTPPEPPLPPPPASPFRESTEEWIELYNRGTSAVDLTGWSLRDAVEFDFPAGTMIVPGEYLVIAGDAAALQNDYPGIADKIVGNFTGRLNDGEENILLRDAAKNPADEVHYYDRGRWPEFADGGGSSLELRDPNSDNSRAEAWAASDETGKSDWNTYSFRQIASNGTGPNIWDELWMGLLDAGEVLIDDIQLIEHPSSTAQNILQNGTFESDIIGSSPATWRITGNQRGTVIVDPDDASNKVLHFIATGVMAQLNNHAETTTTSDIENHTEYQVSFRAKWLRGSNQLNTRLVSNRVASTAILDVPTLNGTPGAMNTAHESNIGPTYHGFQHMPVVPVTSEAVTVTVAAEDPDGIATMTLWWSTNGSTWQSTSMTLGTDGLYSGTIPGQGSGVTVQFYVEGEDTLGACSTYPAAGRDSRALYRVNGGLTSPYPIDTVRLLITPADGSNLFVNTNIFNNNLIGATLVINNEQVFYDIGTRLKGSVGSRPANNPGSYRIRLHPDHKFRDVHDSLSIDRVKPEEIVIKQLFNRMGGPVSLYDDLAYSETGAFQLQLARYDEVFAEETFTNGGDGMLFEYEVVYNQTDTTGGEEGLKRAAGFTFSNGDINDLGDRKENYRWRFQIKNNRQRDDYSQIVALNKAFSLGGNELDVATREVMDIDQWMQTMAMVSLTGNADVYSFGFGPHNVHLYVRPEDNKVLILPHDQEAVFNNSALYGQDFNLRKVIDLPHNQRLYYGHLQDQIATTFNATYFSTWAIHYGDLIGQNFQSSYVGSRAASVTSQLASLAPQVSFTRTTASPLDVVTSPTATIQGTGWINVREIRLAGDTKPLDLNWTVGNGSSYADTWETTIPVAAGTNTYTFEAYDFQGNLIGTTALAITSTATNPVVESLRITELNYNPSDPIDSSDPTDNDQFEFIELQNIGAGSINLLGTRFTAGIDYTFPASLLGAGERVLVVKDIDAFESRYSTGLNVIGEYDSGRLSNGGENITLLDGQGQTVLSFEYGDNDPWPERADGGGGTLEIIDAAATPVAEYGKYYRWRGSTELNGTPAAAGSGPVGVVINEVLAHTDLPVVESDSIELFNTTASPIDISGWWLSDSSDHFFKYQIPGGTVLNAGGYLVFDEDDFNPTPLSPGANDFALSGTSGDDVWLVDQDGGGAGVAWIMDDVHFGASVNGESFGRVPNGAGRLAPLNILSLGSDNGSISDGVRVGELVIGEVHYHPTAPSAAALAVDPTISADDLEFIEVYNTSALAVDLTEWRIRGGVDFDFAAGSLLGAGEVIVVVSFDPDSAGNASRLAAFRTNYGIDASVALVGGYQGRLSDSFERVELQRPGTPPLEDPTLTPRLLEDEVFYDDLLPWPGSVDGLGDTLHRTGPSRWGSQVASWTAGGPGPGTVDRPGDTDLDGDVDTGDLTTAIINFTGAGGSGKAWPHGDVDGDGDVDTGDLTTAIINFTGASASGRRSAKSLDDFRGRDALFGLR